MAPTHAYRDDRQSAAGELTIRVATDAVDYSIVPCVIGRFVDVSASPDEVLVSCNGQLVARHRRCWAKHAVITDPAHVAPPRRCGISSPTSAADGRSHATTSTDIASLLRALPDYDDLFGVDFGTETALSTAESLIRTERTP
jgi:hypothetical protein